MSDDFTYFCYRCGTKNEIDIPKPNAPDYHHASITCKKCADSTHVLISHCPNCHRYVYWIDDMSIPDLVSGFAKYMVHNMQAMIDRAATQGASISMDTPDHYPINSTCPCGTTFTVKLPIPDLD